MSETRHERILTRPTFNTLYQRNRSGWKSSGLPVFCLGNGGFLCLIGLGGGWLLAFAPAVWLVGTLYQRLTFNPNLRILVACLAGEGVIFLGGLLWIAMLSGGETALILADLTLLLPGLLKIALVVSASPLLNKVRL